MQPALWIGYKEEVYAKSYDEGPMIQINFPKMIIASHMRVLLIDAYRRSDTNIDVDYVVPGGFPIN